MESKKPDFSGWATRSNIKCTDGRTIMHNAFAHQHQVDVPLVWQHRRDEPENVLGHATLEDRAFGVYTHGYFYDDHPKAIEAKELVHSRQINALSIYATGLVQRGLDVYYGNIEEVSLVPSGANPGALIETVNLSHGDEMDPLDSEAIIYSGLTLEHQDQEGESGVAENANTETEEKSLEQILETLNDEQKEALAYLVVQALEASEEVKEDGESDDSAEETSEDEESSDEVEHSISAEDFLAHIDKTLKEGVSEMTRNVFQQFGDGTPTSEQTTLGSSTLTHADFSTLVSDLQKRGGSLKEAVLEHNDYGITNIEMLFPDAKNLENIPDFVSRRMEWVKSVLNGTKHSPFAKVKTVHADITEPEARAKGYITGKRKKEEVFKLLKRTTSPTTIYKKQKLDRDDIIDITDFDVVLWLRAEMRLMLEEELARAILVGDGRQWDDEDKVKDPAGSPQGDGIRSIFNDDELYAHPVTLPPNVSPLGTVEGIIRARINYKGSGSPTLFMSDYALTEILLEKDKFGRYLYATERELVDKLRVKEIVPVEIFGEHEDLLAIMVNLSDYTIGANKGGQITNFDDFDIDFNQYKYLIETRLSGALTKPKSALVIKRASGIATTPLPPTFDTEINLLTIPSVTGVEYTIDDEVVTGEIEIEDSVEVRATPAEGYYFTQGSTRSWTFTYTQQ